MTNAQKGGKGPHIARDGPQRVSLFQKKRSKRRRAWQEANAYQTEARVELVERQVRERVVAQGVCGVALAGLAVVAADIVVVLCVCVGGCECGGDWVVLLRCPPHLWATNNDTQPHPSDISLHPCPQEKLLTGPDAEARQVLVRVDLDGEALLCVVRWSGGHRSVTVSV